MDPALQTYIAESRELLQDMENALLNLEHEDEKSELLNAIFRAAHTIKGSAGLFGLDEIVAFTHGAESLLDRLREGEIAITEEIIALLLSCRDHINDLIDHIESDGAELGEEIRVRGELLSEQLKLSNGSTGLPVRTAIQPSQARIAGVKYVSSGEATANENWHISLRFGRDSLRDGMDPLSFLRYLGTLGEIINVITLDDWIPAVDDMDPESCYLGFEISFKSDIDKATIEGAFDFIRQDSTICILPPRCRVIEYVNLIQELPEEDTYLGEILVRCGSLTQTELDEALTLQQQMMQEDVSQPIGSILVEQKMTSQTVVDAAVQKQAQVRENKAREAQSVRVDADKLDDLINLVGELVIAGAGASIDVVDNGDSSLIESISTVTRLVEEVRDSALRLRMVQIGGTFNRFQRIVRDVSKELNKEIDLVISGAETELDKTVVEKIGDPLMHLVRNSIDHGIESPEVRESKGKSKIGIVRLNAYHDSGSIIIEVSDDGSGLDRERIVKKAIEKGLISPEQNLEEHEVYNLIFEPGFSTADHVSNLSGRGVGMDVVKRNITSLRGTVDVESASGAGTTFRVRLPLTLAIIDGFLVGVEKASFVVPLDMVFECVELGDINGSDSVDRHYINLRGEVLPFVRLREIFDTGGEPPRRESIVVVKYAGVKAGLVVDRLMGEFQTVIKPLGTIFKHVHGLGGSTILGNGEVALILDVPGLLQQVSQLGNHAATSAA